MDKFSQNDKSRAKAMLDFDKRYQRIQTSGVCFYCGDDAQTGDHVPPISIARKRDPETLHWLVPSCQRCNHVLGKNHRTDLRWRREYVLSRRMKLGDELDMLSGVEDLYIWIMPPMHEDDLKLIGRASAAVSGGALKFVQACLGGDMRRSVLHFKARYHDRIARGISGGMISRALRDPSFIWGFGITKSMLPKDRDKLNDSYRA